MKWLILMIIRHLNFKLIPRRPPGVHHGVLSDSSLCATAWLMYSVSLAGRFVCRTRGAFPTSITPRRVPRPGILPPISPRRRSRHFRVLTTLTVQAGNPVKCERAICSSNIMVAEDRAAGRRCVKLARNLVLFFFFLLDTLAAKHHTFESRGHSDPARLPDRDSWELGYLRQACIGAF
jgi:hypothetical protein